MRIVAAMAKGRALAERSGTTSEIDVSLVDPVAAGDHVLVFLGSARRILSEAEAQAIDMALLAVERAGSGGDIDACFADLAGRSPQLPPHMQAARDAGHTEV
ncbi:HypC/HybG/HupF family hydrogenase formation chaperone [Jiella sp. LLJ827]|nr:HypC/HybG/HupF family hydrogenase formation chaperone [Jiella sp. LLJ827]